ncbi:DUF760 domain-containing protein [Calothrix sp. 336/3]|uniref:DUF760 domain-containing protein n=1 Tax=Calothrix sp. 336/3 TaxID=1337936 RepID=UPI0004E43DF3|nr:DUF760 domain-containing protein [Calothrix sp. 336/3]AKG24001.1 hypothetical protein IJ00_24230 [Calothrix sp. 336/3]
MSNLSHPQPNYFADNSDNSLLQYVQSLNPQTVAELSQPGSAEILDAIRMAIAAILANLSTDRFNQLITTNRDELGRILGSAMVDGYFLRNVEERFILEQMYKNIEDKQS